MMRKPARFGCAGALRVCVCAALALGAGCGGASRGGPKAREFDPEVAERETTHEKLFERGKMFAQVGDLTRAEEYFSAALERGASDAEVFPWLVRVCMQDARYRLALKHTEEHLRKHPGDTDALRIQGSLYFAIGDGAHAEQTLLRVAGAAPADAETQFMLAVLYRDLLKDEARARARFRSYLQLAPSGKHAEEARGNMGAE